MTLFGFSSHRYEMLMSAALHVYATRCTANCIALSILIGTYTDWLMIYMPSEVMPASIFTHRCKLLYTKPMLTWICSITQQSSRTEVHFRHRVTYGSGWIASPATRDRLSWHWISWHLLPFKPMLNDCSCCVVI